MFRYVTFLTLKKIVKWKEMWTTCYLCLSSLLMFFFFFSFEGLTWGNGVSLAIGWTGATAGAYTKPQQGQIRTASATYAAACSNPGSLTHWARPGIEPTSSWTLCQVLNPQNLSGNFWFLSFSTKILTLFFCGNCYIGADLEKTVFLWCRNVFALGA